MEEEEEEEGNVHLTVYTMILSWSTKPMDQAALRHTTLASLCTLPWSLALLCAVLSVAVVYSDVCGDV